MSTKAGDWTADELLSELRRRERDSGRKKGLRGGERGASDGGGGRPRALDRMATGALAKLARDRQRVVYGVDDRKDLYRVTSASVRAAASGVVALVKSADLKPQRDGSYKLATRSYQEEYSLCGNEPFASQPLGCFCSGFLVAPDLVATAGHCVKAESDLATMRFVFGFSMLDANAARTAFPAADVYKGVSLIGRELNEADGTDWALVRLDRVVTGRKPVKVRTSGKVGNSQPLFVIGHPCGLPQKYAPGAKVRDNTPAPYFVANLDTYGGNSGSPVFNVSSGAVEGILVRGENDFVSNGTCNVSLVCPTTGCRGEDVMRSSVWAGKVPRTAPERAPRAAVKKRAGGASKRASASKRSAKPRATRR